MGQLTVILDKFESYKNSIAKLVCAVLIVLCAYSVYSIHQSLLSPKSIPLAVVQPIVETNTLPNIADSHLFGLYSNNPNQLPETSLQLQLQGTLFSSAAADSRAIIAQSGGQPKVYEIGQTVPGGATIKAIEQKQIILNYNNQLELLRLPVPKLN